MLHHSARAAFARAAKCAAAGKAAVRQVGLGWANGSACKVRKLGARDKPFRW